MESSMEVPQILEIQLSDDPAIQLLGIHIQRKQNHRLAPRSHCSVNHSTQEVEMTQYL